MTYVRTLTLTDFLLARIAEDEVDAQAALDDDQHWLHLGNGQIIQGDREGRCHSGWLVMPHRWEAADHIARWDPARVLAECGAKRRIIEQLDKRHQQGLRSAYAQGEVDANRFAVRLLALPYADHPDYRTQWRP